MMFSKKTCSIRACQALCARDSLLDSLLLMGLWEKCQVGYLQLDVFVSLKVSMRGPAIQNASWRWLSYEVNTQLVTIPVKPCTPDLANIEALFWV